MTSYYELLRDPRWQKKRLEVLSRSNFSCEECCAKDKTLNVHHIQYRKGAKPWEYDESELASLCEDCHRDRHDLETQIRAQLARLTREELAFTLGFLRARAALNGDADLPLKCESDVDGASKALCSYMPGYELLMEIASAGHQVLTPKQVNDVADLIRKKVRAQH